MVDNITKYFLGLFLSSILSWGALTTLTKTVETGTAFDTVSTTWSSPPDDGNKQIVIGFDFPYGDSTYSQLYLQTNGAITFTSGTIPYGNTNQYYQDAKIYPYWDDMNPSRGGSIKYDLLDAGTSNERFVVSWLDVPHYPSTGSYSFQVVLYKDGSIRFRYDDSSNTDGSSATIGIDISSSNYDAHSYNSTTTFDASKDIVYSLPTAKMSLTKESCVIEDPINGTTNPKRIPNATIRYAIEVKNEGSTTANDVKVDDTLSNDFDSSTIENLQVQLGNCDCLGVSSANNNGVNGTGDGENPIVLDFGNVVGGSESNPTVECGYFEVKLF